MFYAASAVRQIQSAPDTRAASAATKARQVEGMVSALHMDVERLLMITEALWGLLKEQHGYSDEELAERITEIDMRDGRLDGRVAKAGPATCPTCKRALIGKRPICLYCGQALQPDPFQR